MSSQMTQKQLKELTQAAEIVAAANAGDYAKARAQIEAVKLQRKSQPAAEAKKEVRKEVKKEVKQQERKETRGPNKPPGPQRERKQAVREFTQGPAHRFTGPRAEIARIIMLPSKGSGRLPIMCAEPSAIVPLKVTDDLPGNTTGATVGVPDLPNTEQCALKFKDSALRSLILWYGSVPTRPRYDAAWNNSGAIGLTTQITLAVGVEVDPNPLYWQNVLGTKVHGTNLYLGKAADGRRYTFATGSSDAATTNASFVWGFTAVPANQQLLVRIYRTSGDVPTVVGETTIASGVTTWTATIPKTGGYRFTFTLQPSGGTPSTANLACTFFCNHWTCSANGASTWGQKALPNLEAKVSQIDEYTIHGSDLTITEAASMTNTNGRVLQVSNPAGTPVEVAAVRTFATLGQINARRYVSRALKKGCDGFIKPAGITEFDMATDFDCDSGGVLNSCSYSWVPTEPYIQFSLYVPTFAGQVFSYTSGDAIEYLTPDPWTNLGEKRIGKNAMLNDVIESLTTVPQFYDNEDHEKNILAMLGPIATAAAVGMMIL